MEIWDLYDRDGNRTGETWERQFGNYKQIPDGRYHMVVDILVQHVDGTYLLTKRDDSKDVYPGFWEASAGGSAQTGEHPEECAKRELYEETGIRAESFELINIAFRDLSHSLVYSFVTVVDCDKESIVLQEEETTDYKWVDAKGLIEYSKSDLAIKTSVERYKKFYDKVRQTMEKDMTVACGDGLINIRVGAIIIKDGKFLMVGSDRTDYYYSVGGRVQFGETAEDAVIREVFEETGIKMEVERLGFVHENYFFGDAPTNMGKLIYEISFFFYMKMPENFKPINDSFTDGENKEHLVWVSADIDKKIYPEFFRRELLHPAEEVKHFVTDGRTY